MEFTTLIIIFLIIVLSTLPLYLSVNLMGGRTTFIKTFLVMILAGVITLIINLFFPIGSLIAFLILILVYKEMFYVGWIKAFFIWVFQIVFIFIITFVLVLFGVLGSITALFF